MPRDTDIPPQYRRVRISTIDDDELLNKLVELERTTKEEMAAMRDEIRSLKDLIHKLVDDQGVVVSSRTTTKKRRLIQISEADDEDSGGDVMMPHMPVMQNDTIPSQSSLDDNENEEAGDEKEQADDDNNNDNDGGDEVDNDGKEVVEDGVDQEMEVPQEYQPPNSYGEELFDESEEISNEKSSSYPGISSSDLPSDFFKSPLPQQSAQPQQSQQPEPQQPEPQQPQQSQQPKPQEPEPQEPEPQQSKPQEPEQAQPLQQYHMNPELTTVNEVWVEWKVGDNCIEKLIERYGDEWRYAEDSPIFMKRKILVEEIEYIVKKCDSDDDYDTKCRKAIEALETRRKERGSLNRLCFLIKAFQNSALQAVRFDGIGEREAYVSI
ncbi:hypothetical protein O0I10_006857 [Lichtheimia ornata]|uniref:Transcription activator GCR1-like domain-containing protein n=1 Tax=Lichtheimia ornata TaxID=688661 RepID=A0AAD7V3K5_9FUNG|nr:uncharacterized protein O0I10_006857 [Lichtheimia ornata]KAJ8657555.1 hypothetical protein O0I10_006857 [Lichtheimia ornata]